MLENTSGAPVVRDSGIKLQGKQGEGEIEGGNGYRAGYERGSGNVHKKRELEGSIQHQFLLSNLRIGVLPEDPGGRFNRFILENMWLNL